MDPELHQSRPRQDESSEERLKIGRRRSGELVHSALHASTRRTSTVTPISTCVKSVHFGTDLEQARSFFQLDSPNSISTESSVIHDEDSDCQYNLLYNDEHDAQRPSVKWKLLTQDAFLDTDSYRRLPIALRNLSLNDDQSSIYGSFDVANLALEKIVVCRFTCDEWNTVSEVSAHNCTDAYPTKTCLEYDCFKFEIDICNIPNLESTSFSCCIRYAVDGKEFWDYESAKFQVRFCKHLSSTGMEGAFEKNSCSSTRSFTRGVRDSKTGPGLLGPLPLPAPGIELGYYGSIDGGDTKVNHQIYPKHATSSDRYSLKKSLPQSIQRASKTNDCEGRHIYSRTPGHCYQSGGNVNSTRTLKSKTYRGVQSADITLPMRPHEELLER